jgi:hypothetical protein
VELGVRVWRFAIDSPLSGGLVSLIVPFLSLLAIGWFLIYRRRDLGKPLFEAKFSFEVKPVADGSPKSAKKEADGKKAADGGEE